ncbi:PilZ domain-containing protein [Pseudophaeobacter arcticus]|uniref:PilZ domain-containing protein n=1 Tax=Pseudophaeobacter arcticus TaxID=385492 RepID=UPI002491BCEE|nr:PilZ domain-containing protein [Pseudophaeobacter arcticus]
MFKVITQNLQVIWRRKAGNGCPECSVSAAQRLVGHVTLQGKRRCARFLLLVALFLGGAGATSAQEMNCRVFDDLTTLVHLSEDFLDNVETGADTGAANRLSNFLRKTPVVELRLLIVENGFEKISTPTAKLVALQKTILKMRSIGGQFKAAEAARKLRVRDKLEVYRKELVALPCGEVNGFWRTAGETVSEALVTSKTAGIGALMVLILGVVAFVLFDRMRQKKSDIQKRFVCRIDCKVKAGKEEEDAEARIVDVSRIGAKVKTETVYKVGSEIEVVLPRKRINFPDHAVTYDSWSFVGKIVWSKGDYLGLEFTELMEQDRLKQLISVS